MGPQAQCCQGWLARNLPPASRRGRGPKRTEPPRADPAVMPLLFSFFLFFF